MEIGGGIALGGGGITQITGDVLAGPGLGSVSSLLAGTANVNQVIARLATIATQVTRRSATAQAALGETTVFAGSTSGQTITLPNLGSLTNGAYRIVNDATVTVSILGGTNSLSINGTIYGASTPFVVAVNTTYNFVWDGTGIWQCVAISRNAAASLTYDDSWTSGIALGTTYSTILTTASWAVGTWLLTVNTVAHLGTSAPANASFNAGLTGGSGSGTFLPHSILASPASLGVASSGSAVPLTMTFIVIVTGAGNFLLQAIGANLGTTPTVDMSYTAVKIV